MDICTNNSIPICVLSRNTKVISKYKLKDGTHVEKGIYPKVSLDMSCEGFKWKQKNVTIAKEY